jgi:hypothetical protein
MEALEWRKPSCCWQELNKIHWLLLKDGSIRTEGFCGRNIAAVTI